MRLRAILIILLTLSFLSAAAGGYLHFSCWEGCELPGVAICLLMTVFSLVLYVMVKRELELQRTGGFLTVSERKRAEEAQRESQEKFLKVFRASPDSISIATLHEGRYIDVNEAFLHGTGYEHHEVIGRTSLELAIWDNPEDRGALVRKLEEVGSLRNQELRYRTRSGEVRTMLCSADIIELEKERYLLMVSRDITERKRLEEQVRQSQKLKSIGVLAGGVAHDFNNLLQIIQGYAELLVLKRPKGDPDVRKIEGIIQAARRGSELTRQMLTFSRNVEAKKRPLNLNNMIEQVGKLFEQALPKKIEINQYLEPDLRFVNADAFQIEQVLMNLVVNAKDAMHEGGKVIIETRNITLDMEHCRTYPQACPGDHVLLSVSDTGCGMDQDTIEHIFEPFYSTKGVGSGTGLGLAIVYGIVQNHGGHIICYSEPGLGTTFRIYLPAIDRDVGPQITEEELADSTDMCREVVLLIEDEDLVRDLVAEILMGAGYTVLSAANGEGGLQLYEREKDRIDLVILDLIMPGMGGKRCLEGILKLNPKARVLIASGFSADDPEMELGEGRIDGYVRKPYEVRRLLLTVRAVLDKEPLS